MARRIIAKQLFHRGEPDFSENLETLILFSLFVIEEIPYGVVMDVVLPDTGHNCLAIIFDHARRTTRGQENHHLP